jgi:putative sterol carrier protein
MFKSPALILMAILVLASTGAATAADTVLMSRDWVTGMCAAWNQDEALTKGLAKWMENDNDRGYKLLRIYRMDCPDSPQIELRVADKEGAVTCIEAGLATDQELMPACDYVMFAKTDRWLEMGAGKYGPMVGMMTGRLKFEGPKWEAMKNMGPFKSFLQLVGKVPGASDSCPTLPIDDPVEAEESMETPETTEVGR